MSILYRVLNVYVYDLIGYPDGWNNFTYCNNKITIAFDLYGAVLIYPDSIKTSIDILKKTTTGNSIISQLEKSSHIHTINESSSGKGSSVSASNKANMSNPESGGTGSTINMDNFNPNNTSPDDSGWSRPYELGLLHELAHAAEMDKGTLPQGQTGGVDNSEIDACKKN